MQASIRQNHRPQDYERRAARTSLDPDRTGAVLRRPLDNCCRRIAPRTPCAAASAVRRPGFLFGLDNWQIGFPHDD